MNQLSIESGKGSTRECRCHHIFDKKNKKISETFRTYTQMNEIFFFFFYFLQPPPHLFNFE